MKNRIAYAVYMNMIHTNTHTTILIFDSLAIYYVNLLKMKQKTTKAHDSQCPAFHFFFSRKKCTKFNLIIYIFSFRKGNENKNLNNFIFRLI